MRPALSAFHDHKTRPDGDVWACLEELAAIIDGVDLEELKEPTEQETDGDSRDS